MNIPSINPDNETRAFTLMDLLVLIATLAVLAAVVMPALAGVQNKGGRLECANNLRQIGTASMIFASENNGWFPVCTLGSANGEGAKSNYFGGMHYSTYVYYEGVPYTQITTNEAPIRGGGYQNLGYLYEAGLAGNGSIFYCPATWGTFYGANDYNPLLTADVNGVVRSSYFYNPRIMNPYTGQFRRYQTVSQLEPHRLFAVDSIYGGSVPSTAPPDTSSYGSGVNPASIEHAPDHGWNVLFTDGSVQFSRLPQNNNYYYNLIIEQLVLTESAQSFAQYDSVFNWLEEDH